MECAASVRRSPLRHWSGSCRWRRSMRRPHIVSGVRTPEFNARGSAAHECGRSLYAPARPLPFGCRTRSRRRRQVPRTSAVSIKTIAQPCAAKLSMVGLKYVVGSAYRDEPGEFRVAPTRC
jgi:hypothetical protein